MMKESLKKLEEELSNVPYEKPEQSSKDNEIEIVHCENESNFTTLTEKDARRILESEVFFTKIGKNLQNKLQIVKISHSYVYTYGLQTWVEKRQLFWQFKKYKFGRIDDQSFGLIPDAWDVSLPETADKLEPFSDREEKVVLKHSEYVQPCFNCSNLLQNDCVVCGGNKKLIYYLNCKINWHNYKDVYITEPNCIPFNKLKQAPAELIYDVDDTKVNPIKCPENEDVGRASERYHKQHKKNSKKEKVLRQRQYVKKIEVYTIYYSYKNKVKRVFVYGDRKHKEVHVPYSLATQSTASNMLACVFL